MKVRHLAIVCVVAALAIALAGCASGESYAKPGFDFSTLNSVAVVSVEGLNSKAAQNQIADFFNIELLKKGYSPIERSQIDKILQEQKFQASDVTSTEGAVEAGRILNVSAVMLVNIPKFKEDIHMTAKLVDVQDGSILWMGEGQGTTGKFATTVVAAAAGAVAGAALGGEHNVGGAVAGGVLGGVAGHTLTPNEETQARKVIAKVTQTLPWAIPKPAK